MKSGHQTQRRESRPGLRRNGLGRGRRERRKCGALAVGSLLGKGQPPETNQQREQVSARLIIETSSMRRLHRSLSELTRAALSVVRVSSIAKAVTKKLKAGRLW
jgi:hypothetical protein